MIKKIGKALVVGAGISGIRAALDLAETGYGVTLIDRSPHLGGILSQLDYQFPTNRCGMCKMLPLIDRDASSQYCLRKGLFHENIEILLSTELITVEGEPGNFQVKLRQKPNWVDPARCIGCGECAAVCPVEVPDDFNAGFVGRKAIYLPIPHAIPNPYQIDFSVCTRCGECEKICPTGAIRLSEQEREKYRILVVDDELIVRDSLKELLEDEGFSADVAESGRQALEKLGDETYHLMLTDIKMPEMDGVELLQKAKESYPDLTVVMMTAYATVETAVEAMKIGALDYLIKPFNPDTLVPTILDLYENLEAAKARQLEVGALVFCGGTDYYDPVKGKNTFGYRTYPNVVTSLEFERIFSGSGPSRGNLVRPYDGKPIQRVAWIQCVGSRDLQSDADFCSNVCCMYAVKEALLAKEKTNGELDTTIFYMDMRTFGKSYQRYCDAAVVQGVHFERGRVHSVVQDKKSGDLVIRYADQNGVINESHQDLVVLSVGQRPSKGMDDLAEMLGIRMNQWGFVDTEPFSLNKSNREGIYSGGAFTGLKDINESMIQASAAALSASSVIHASGGGLFAKTDMDHGYTDVSNVRPKILVAVCACGNTISDVLDSKDISTQLVSEPYVETMEFLGQICTASGWEALVKLAEDRKPNRILIGSCLPYVYARKLRTLANQLKLNPVCMEVVDIRTPFFSLREASRDEIAGRIIGILKMGIAKLKHIDPTNATQIPIHQNALIVGGGIAGMTAALAIADHGFQVNLVEQTERLGGNLLRLRETIDGSHIGTYLNEVRQKIEKHPFVKVFTNAHIQDSYGEVGLFSTSIEVAEKHQETISHGVTILATGGKEAVTESYGYGTSEQIVTQMELERQLTDKTLKPAQLKSIVMIQCVDSREEPRNYCSRVCCTTALKHALDLKKQSPDMAIYILNRDMMSYGFNETYYTQARKAGVFFIQYEIENKPKVDTEGGSVNVTVFEPIIGQDIKIQADLLVLATGIVPSLSVELADKLGCSVDRDGFFEEAETKWRPVDSLKEGVFACGIVHSPRSISETTAMAEAAAQRSIRILTHDHLAAGKVVAKVRSSICSLCERCIDACPYGARSLNDELDQVLVNSVMCQGCGSCATVCPNSASILEGFQKQQVFEIIDAALL